MESDVYSILLFQENIEDLWSYSLNASTGNVLVMDYYIINPFIKERYSDSENGKKKIRIK